MPEMTEKEAEEFIAKYGDMNEEQLLDEIVINLLETNPEGVKQILAKEGDDTDIEGLLEFMKEQRKTERG